LYFTNPDHAVRRKAIELTKRGIDEAGTMGAPSHDLTFTVMQLLDQALIQSWGRLLP
jgi:hypothetical protein